MVPHLPNRRPLAKSSPDISMVGRKYRKVPHPLWCVALCSLLAPERREELRTFSQSTYGPSDTQCWNAMENSQENFQVALSSSEMICCRMDRMTIVVNVDLDKGINPLKNTIHTRPCGYLERVPDLLSFHCVAPSPRETKRCFLLVKLVKGNKETHACWVAGYFHTHPCVQGEKDDCCQSL